MRAWLAKLWRSLTAGARAFVLAFRREWAGPSNGEASSAATCRVWTGPTLDALTPATPLVGRKVAHYRYADLVTDRSVRAVRLTDGTHTLRERQK